LDMGARALAAQQAGIQVTGHNLANVNNTAYARQRLNLQTSLPVAGPGGWEGTGLDAGSVVQIRNSFLDAQMVSEASAQGSLETQQSALQQLQSDLGQTLAGASDPSSASTSTPTPGGLAGGLTDLFNAFQSLSTDPSSLGQRSVLLMKASGLASQFNQVDQYVGQLSGSLDQSVSTNVDQANQLLSDIASLNGRIAQAETSAPGSANDVRDLRQQKLEELGKLVKVDVGQDGDNSLTISVSGSELVSGSKVLDTLGTYASGNETLLVQTAGSNQPLTLTGGQIEGAITVRDGEVAALRKQINSLASQLITQVNAIHRSGFGLEGSTGADFFTGTNAADIGVNADLADNPDLVQASGVKGAVGDNQVALALGRLANQTIPALQNQTLSQNYATSVTGVGQSLATVTTQVSDQQAVQTMLSQQRDSVSGVSLDEEMTNLTAYQRAFEASAKLITTVDEMLTTIVNMKT